MAVIRYLVHDVDVAVEFYVSGPGGKLVLVNDPSGNPIELFEPSNQ